jgi:Tripartite tricarboxylate transporter family receptor
VRLIVGFAAGGATDVFARVMGQWLAERLGQQFVVENRPGASGNLATEAVVNAPADGHTLLLTAPANTINASLYEKLSFDFIRDIAPVASIVRTFYVMEVNPSVPVKSAPGRHCGQNARVVVLGRDQPHHILAGSRLAPLSSIGFRRARFPDLISTLGCYDFQSRMLGHLLASLPRSTRLSVVRVSHLRSQMNWRSHPGQGLCSTGYPNEVARAWT